MNRMYNFTDTQMFNMTNTNGNNHAHIFLKGVHSIIWHVHVFLWVPNQTYTPGWSENSEKPLGQQ